MSHTKTGPPPPGDVVPMLWGLLRTVQMPAFVAPLTAITKTASQARVRDWGRLGGGLGPPENCTWSAVQSVTMGMGFKKACNVDCKQRMWDWGPPSHAHVQ